MTNKAAPSRRTRAGARVDVRGWLGGIRLSGFAVIMLGLVVLGAFILVPSVSGYIDMRQQIAAAQAGVEVTKDDIAELQREQDRWHDPAYIMSEARSRLYFTKPGETVYLVEDDLPDDEAAETPAPVSDEATEEKSDWMGTMLRSVVESGLAEQATGDTGDDSVFQPTPEATETPAG
ncbi:FtsB family cell division protein [Microbacterium indicum]|uniref:FtsB family cell division protein n=1 Tax=Microbacterium indicum TaxID=358100 RepID=UPI000420D6B2|nr:septum formation initiator family protein [Microbacterium indicum]